jgi:S1-C subfamily serine protease
MMRVKRTLTIAVVLVLSLATVGVLTANASAPTPTPTAAQQTTGKGWLGVAIADSANGVTVQEVVSGSPADTAGLKVGDIIKAVDGTDVTTAQQLSDAIGAHAPGDQVTLSILSQGDTQPHDVSVTLGEAPAQTTTPQQTQPYRAQGMLNLLGITAEWQNNGLLIQSIANNSPLKDSGLQAGDLITQIDGTPIAQAFPGILMQILRSDQVTVTVMRNGQEQNIDITLNLPNLGIGQAGVAPTQPTQLGVQYKMLTAAIAQQEGLSVNEGAEITQVFDNTPAATAGLQVGDIITAVDGNSVDQQHTLSQRLYSYAEGDKVTLTVLRSGQEMKIDVTLGPRPSLSQIAPGNGPYGPFFRGRQGRPYTGPMGPNMGPHGQFHFRPFRSNPGPNQNPAPQQTPTPQTGNPA